MLPAHSMEEAEVLCDRLGIFVDGDFQCLGNPKEVHHLLESQKSLQYVFQFLISLFLERNAAKG